jgi:hypothetical protein
MKDRVVGRNDECSGWRTRGQVHKFMTTRPLHRSLLHLPILNAIGCKEHHIPGPRARRLRTPHVVATRAYASGTRMLRGVARLDQPS